MRERNHGLSGFPLLTAGKSQTALRRKYNVVLVNLCKVVSYPLCTDHGKCHALSHLHVFASTLSPAWNALLGPDHVANGSSVFGDSAQENSHLGCPPYASNPAQVKQTVPSFLLLLQHVHFSINASPPPVLFTRLHVS